jgi:hypothetical protein
MPRTVAELAEKMNPPARIHAALSCQAGQTLSGHVKEGCKTRQAIAGEISEQVKKMQAEASFLESAAKARPDDALAKADLARPQADLKALEGTPKWDVVVIQPCGGDDTKDQAADAATSQCRPRLQASEPHDWRPPHVSLRAPPIGSRPVPDGRRQHAALDGTCRARATMPRYAWPAEGEPCAHQASTCRR